jgi:hypothetical protein
MLRWNIPARARPGCWTWGVTTIGLGDQRPVPLPEGLWRELAVRAILKLGRFSAIRPE